MRTAENGWKARDWLRKTENGWERLRMAGRRAVHYHETTRPRDRETTRPRDNETTGPRDHGTTRLRDYGTTEKHRRSQAFPGILSRAWLRVAVRGCARQLGVRVVQMWCQVEVWLDGGVLARTSPFRRTSLVPQMRRYHVKLSHQAGYFIGIIFLIPKSWTFCSSSSLLSDTKRSLSPGFSCVCPLGTK